MYHGPEFVFCSLQKDSFHVTALKFKLKKKIIKIKLKKIKLKKKLN